MSCGVVILDYGAGNLASVRLAFASLGVEARIAAAAADVRTAERIVFPGVGAAGAAMASLVRLGLADAVRDVVGAGIPFFGICLGAQILLSRSEEDRGVDTLGLIPGEVKRFQPADRYDKVPHMGWNSVGPSRPHPLFDGIDDDSEFYFVHSYYPDPEPSAVLGTTGYAGIRFASVVGRANLVATQFHPEKSGPVGLRMLDNFVRWNP